MDQNAKKQAVAKAAIEYVEADSIVGVGTGSTVNSLLKNSVKLSTKLKVQYQVQKPLPSV